MISAMAYIVSGIVICLGLGMVWDHFWGFRAQRPADYAMEKPAFDLRAVLSGRFEAHGAIFDYSGRANVRFTAHITGTFDENGGVLAERFR